MAKRDSVYRPNDAESAMVIGPSVYDVPLLPYERQLIATIGITEEEYRAFTAEVRKRGAVRPAAYDHIPDVQAGGVGETILINLAISLVLTGVSYLLTPKPKMPRAQGGGVTDLGSITGANRFTPSRGFETLAELADYASPVPIIFGMYKNDIGGMLVTPKLIWSRMFSHGTAQRAKLMFVVGEQGVNDIGIDKPELEGIFLGNNPLDAIFEDNFAFYWHKASFSSNFRIRGTDKQYGTRGPLASGDPGVGKEDDDDVFVFPVSDINKEPGEIFCHAYTPANSTKFGAYGAIANGTGYRVNYQLISIPVVDDEKAMAIRTLERIKIVGDSGVRSGDEEETLQESEEEPGKAPKDRLNEIRRKGNHAGTGRNYSPRMGVIQYTRFNSNTDIFTADGFPRKTIDNVEKGDKIKFVIRNEVEGDDDKIISKDFYRKEGRGASVEDINSTVESLQNEADSALQVGEHFEIGGCFWKVVKRTRQTFDPSEEQVITLECVDVLTSVNKKIGIVSKDLVLDPKTQFIGDTGVGDSSRNVGELFFPLTKIEVATIKNNRPAISTEIGLKSTVFQRLNGICNFQGLPTPSELNDAEEDGIQINNGTISASILRSSIFRIFVRNPNSSTSGGITDFIAFPKFFVVQGRSPVAQYNYIKFTTELPLQLEYKFVPVSGSEFRGLPPTNTEFVVLSQSISTDQNEKGADNFFEFETPIPGIKGSVKIQVSGKEIHGKSSFNLNKEFTRGYREIEFEKTLSFPDDVKFVTSTPSVERGTIATIGSELIKDTNLADPGITTGKLGAFFYEIAGRADDFQVPVGKEMVFRTIEYIGGNHANWLHLEWRLEKKPIGVDSYVKDNGLVTGWRFVEVHVIGSGGGFSGGQKIEVKRGSEATNVVSGQSQYSDSNPYVNNNPSGIMRFSGMRLIINIDGVTENVSLFSRAQAWRYETGFGAVGLPASTKTITKTFNEGDKKITVKLKSTVEPFEDVETKGTRVGNTYGWSPPKVIEILKTSDTTKNWNVGDTFNESQLVSENNPFKAGYDRVGATYEITSVSYDDAEDPIKEADVIFSHNSQVSDISNYREFVEKSNKTSPEHEIVYINEAQLNDSEANMLGLTIAGLSLKASRNFTSLDQIRCWLGSGLPVERLHPAPIRAYGDSNTTGPSNLFTDLVYFLLTDQQAGAGGLLGMDSERAYLVEKQDLVNTSKFLEAQKLFFNGPIVERTNLRQFISELAPYFLCNFIISDGKFSLKPAVPTSSGGEIDTGAVDVKQIFTGGNILEDSYKLEYLGAEERRPFKAVVRYRQERKNRLPEEQVVIVKAAKADDDFTSPGIKFLPEEQFDLTQFCTSKDHAVKVAKYFLALRAYVTHTISFSTTAEGLNIGAGSYIKVVTEASPYSPANNGSVSNSGVVTSVVDMPDGFYLVTFFKVGSDDIDTKQMQVSNGKVESSTFHNIVFTVEDTTVSENIYIVEQLTFSQDGIVDIVASEHPCNDDGTSKIAAFVASTSGFSIDS